MGRPVRATPRVYGGLSPDERRFERRERLIEAGLALFGTVGYGKTSIERLCTEASVATRHFYEEFEGREALLRATYDRVIALARDAVLDALSHTHDDPRERIRAGLGAFVRVYMEDPRRGRVACIEIVGVSAELERHRREVIRAFSRIVAGEAERAARAGYQPLRDFSMMAIALTGAVNELVIECLMRDPGPDIQVVTDELVALFLAGMAGAESALSYVAAQGRGTGR